MCALAVGMGAVLRSLLVRLDSGPWGLLQAVPPVPMAAPLRQAAVLALQAAVQVLTAPCDPNPNPTLTLTLTLTSPVSDTFLPSKCMLPQQRLLLHLCAQCPRVSMLSTSATITPAYATRWTRSWLV